MSDHAPRPLLIPAVLFALAVFALVAADAALGRAAPRADRPFRVTCPACHWDLTVYQPERQAIDFGRCKKTSTDEVPR